MTRGFFQTIVTDLFRRAFVELKIYPLSLSHSIYPFLTHFLLVCQMQMFDAALRVVKSSFY